MVSILQETVRGEREMIEVSGLYLESLFLSLSLSFSLFLSLSLSFSLFLSLSLSLTLSASSVRDWGMAATFPTRQQQLSQNSLSKFHLLFFPLALGIHRVHRHIIIILCHVVFLEGIISVYVATLVHARGGSGLPYIHVYMHAYMHVCVLVWMHGCLHVCM